MLRALSKVYEAVINRRNKAYDNGRKPIVHVSLPVISVGNLTVGGSGKSPVVQMIVRYLRSHGHAPAVVMRGYKRASRGLVVVHDGVAVRCTVRDAGDEAFMHASTLHVPVVVDDYKADAAVYASGNLPCSIIVVDDGFQHRALYRNLDVVIVDKRTMMDRGLLPVGRLREPLSSLRRATVVLTTPDVLEAEVSPYCSEECCVAGVEFVAEMPALNGKRVVCVSSIAEPQRFVTSVRKNGAEIAHTIEYPDHHWYTKQEVLNVISLAKKHDADVVTTEKDAVKLQQAPALFAEHGIDFRVLAVQAHLGKNAMQVESLLLSLT